MIRKLLFLLTTLGLAAPAMGTAQNVDAGPEGLPVLSVEVSGIPRGELSPGLRQEIDALPEQPFDAQAVEALARRIEEEQPRFVAAVRSIPETAGVRVVFLVARLSDDRDLESNINARYTVESVEISGVPDVQVSQAVRDDLQALVGERLDPEAAEALEDRLAAELSGYRVNRRISRGSQEGQIRVVFEVERIPWIPFAPSRTKAVYHSKHGVSGVLDWGVWPGDGPHRFTLGLVFSNDDDLIERHQGYRLRYENRRAGTERLGFSLEYSNLREVWRSETLLALQSAPDIPEPYRDRRTLDPSVTFAFSPRLRVSVGASLSRLESLSAAPASEAANAGTVTIGYDQSWSRPSSSAQRLNVSYGMRSGARTLESDLIYSRHFGRAAYAYENGRNSVLSTFSAGRITGRAPLFERFSLGDSSTLRGWNKYDLAPAGAEKVLHHSLDYRHGRWGAFFDTGSVWNHGAEPRIRLSTGLSFLWGRCRPATQHDGACSSMTLAFPLSSSGPGAMFIAKVKF